MLENYSKILVEPNLKTAAVFEEKVRFLDDIYVFGKIREIQLPNYSFVLSTLKINNNSLLSIVHKTPMYNLHFKFDDSFDFKINDKKTRYNSGTYSLKYVTKIDEINLYKDEVKNTIDIFFEENFLEQIAVDEFEDVIKSLKNSSAPTTITVSPEINAIINDIVFCDYLGFKRKTFIELKTKELLLVALINYPINNTLELDLHEDELKSLHKVEKHIKANLRQNLTIPQLSKIAGLNTTKLKESFKIKYNTTVFKYTTDLRIEKAKELILHKNYTISQASYEVGYKNPQHFTIAFKKKLGYLPSQLKTQHKKHP